MADWALHVLGVGSSAGAGRLGSAAAVVERDGAPLLLIDCGPDVLDRFLEAYGDPPAALYLTHLHMDHVGGLEQLFGRLWFDRAWRGRTKLFVHAGLMPFLQARVADYPGVLAEGGVNFWEAFRLLPCSRGFWLDGWWFDVFPTRHHRPGTSYGLRLPGSIVWTGDTRPIPETLEAVACADEPVAHDCGRVGNPSHTGLDDLEREYSDALRRRLLLYHYASDDDGDVLRRAGYRVLHAGERVPLAAPHPPGEHAG